MVDESCLSHAVALPCVTNLEAHLPGDSTETTLELTMFMTAKVHLVSGVVIGALAVIAARQMCKQRKMRKHSGVPTKVEA